VRDEILARHFEISPEEIETLILTLGRMDDSKPFPPEGVP
jgi:hypothetical protein